MAKKTKKKAKKKVETLTHDDASRKNIPTAEFQSVIDKAEESPIRVAYERRNRDLDPQLVWRGKDSQDWSDLVVQAPPLFIQEKVHPKALIDDLMRQTRDREPEEPEQLDLFSDFNGLPDEHARTEFYQHDANWSNRMILGDSLQVMASLAEREGLRGKVQCIYIDPPYGIKFNSNFQWSTTSRDSRDGKREHITREPEQVKAFRDTWRDGVHSYLTYLRDRLTCARDLLASSGSLFVQIGDENLHRVRALLDEVMGDGNFISQITFKKSSSATERYLSSTSDYVLWYAKSSSELKYRPIYSTRVVGGEGGAAYRLNEAKPGVWHSLSKTELESASRTPSDYRILRLQTLTSQRQGRDTSADGAMSFAFEFQGKEYRPSRGRGWTTTEKGMERLARANRIGVSGSSINYKRYFDDARAFPIYNIWDDTQSGSGMEKVYVVQTNVKVVERCVLMATDPGDLVLDPTCGSGTTAYVAEEWGRRWITVDTSRVALALARSRMMGARFPFYLLADSPEGQQKEAKLSGREQPDGATLERVRLGFVYDRAPHITLKSIVDNSEIDVISERYSNRLKSVLERLLKATDKRWDEWEIPPEASDSWTPDAKLAHDEWWQLVIERQREIDRSITSKAEVTYLYDRPHEDRKKARVAGPFTVESVSPHRTLGVGEHDELLDRVSEAGAAWNGRNGFSDAVLTTLSVAGVQQASRDDKIQFSSIKPWPGESICAEGRYLEGEGEGEIEKRAAILIGPEFGTLTRPDLVKAAREAGDADFDVLVVCAFNYEARTTEFKKLGRIPVLKARMNADLHMIDELKDTGKGNLFVIFGEPDIDVLPVQSDGKETRQVQVKINGVDVFHPSTGEIRSDGADGIACWFIDTDYNEESFFVRHAYFLGANDPYKALRTTLKAEVDKEAWETLHSDTSRPFDKPESGRIAVKVINHLGDEVMKVFRVD